MKIFFCYTTILGKLCIGEEDEKITDVFFIELSEQDQLDEFSMLETNLIKEACQQINEYLKGSRKSFELPLEPYGTSFQKKVWEKLLDIPYGETRSYKDIAIAIDNPNACRAVGMANNRNPISIIIPCHRVIGSDGSLVGYGGGLHIKSYLLEMEKKFY